MEQFKQFFMKYKGAFIGGIIAIIAMLFNIHKILIGFLIIAAGALIGNYVQLNKEKVKDTIRKAVDRW